MMHSLPAAPWRIAMRKLIVPSAALACALASAAVAAETRVYRCEEAGRVTYTDVPCANARPVQINAGSAAPDATERLRRDQQALDARAAQLRDIRARDETMERMNAPRPAPPDQPAADPTYYADYYPGSGYGAWNPQKDQARDRRQDRRDDRRDDRVRRDRHIVVKPPPHPSLVR
jgi:hypothetical protein